MLNVAIVGDAVRPGAVQQAPVGQGQDLFGRQRVTAIFAQGLLRRQALHHRLIAVNDGRQQARLALEPDLIKIVLQLAADPQVINKQMRAGRQRLLVQANVAVSIGLDDG